jgi:hypothetical protein
MSLQVNITFHGTVAVVPLYPVDDKSVKPENKAICMLLPHFDTGLVHELAPYIRFPANSLKSSRPIDGHSPDGSLQHVLLDGEQLDLDGGNQSGVDADFDHELVRTPKPKDAQSLYWLPNLERLTKLPPASPPTIDPDLLAVPFKGATTAKLAARTFLRNGKLRTGGVKAALPFVAGNDEDVHHVAREAILTLTVPGESFQISSTPIEGTAGKGANDMVFVAPPGSTSLDLVIGNEPKQDIYSTADEVAIEESHPSTEFGLFYRLCKPGVATVSQALPLGKNKGGSTQLCALAVVNGGKK